MKFQPSKLDGNIILKYNTYLYYPNYYYSTICIVQNSTIVSVLEYEFHAPFC